MIQDRNIKPNQSNLTPLLYSKIEAAHLLNVSVRTVDNLISLKELQVRRIRRRVLIPHSALMTFIRTDHDGRKAA
jgi:excisionase family DNA binding protein